MPATDAPALRRSVESSTEMPSSARSRYGTARRSLGAGDHPVVGDEARPGDRGEGRGRGAHDLGEATEVPRINRVLANAVAGLRTVADDDVARGRALVVAGEVRAAVRDRALLESAALEHGADLFRRERHVAVDLLGPALKAGDEAGNHRGGTAGSVEPAGVVAKSISLEWRGVRGSLAVEGRAVAGGGDAGAPRHQVDDRELAVSSVPATEREPAVAAARVDWEELLPGPRGTDDQSARTNLATFGLDRGRTVARRDAGGDAEIGAKTDQRPDRGIGDERRVRARTAEGAAAGPDREAHHVTCVEGLECGDDRGLETRPFLEADDREEPTLGLVGDAGDAEAVVGRDDLAKAGGAVVGLGVGLRQEDDRLAGLCDDLGLVERRAAGAVGLRRRREHEVLVVDEGPELDHRDVDRATVDDRLDAALVVQAELLGEVAKAGEVEAAASEARLEKLEARRRSRHDSGRAKHRLDHRVGLQATSAGAVMVVPKIVSSWTWATVAAKFGVGATSEVPEQVSGFCAASVTQ